MGKELMTDGTLLMGPLPSATAEKAVQVGEATAQAGKGPVALHEQAQGLHGQCRHAPTADRRRAARAASRRRREGLGALPTGVRAHPLLGGLREHLACALPLRL